MFKHIFLSLAVLGVLFGGMIMVSNVNAVNGFPAIKDAQSKLKTTATGGGLSIQTSGTAIASKIINYTVGVLGVAAVILVIYAGGLWLTAAGSEDKVGKAKKILRSVVVGVIIVGLAYSITAFIISTVIPPE